MFALLIPQLADLTLVNDDQRRRPVYRLFRQLLSTVAGLARPFLDRSCRLVRILPDRSTPRFAVSVLHCQMLTMDGEPVGAPPRSAL